MPKLNSPVIAAHTQLWIRNAIVTDTSCPV